VAKRITLAQRVFWRTCWFFLLFTALPLMRLTATGFWQLPRSGAYLLLSNHVTWFDPWLLGTFVVRRIHYMASAHWFRIPWLRFFLDLYGTFPKKKMAKDRQAMIDLSEWIEAGEIVGIFPEGRRSWDGRTLTVLPRIGRLIKRLDCPVVFCRNINGHLHQPRWAHYPRLTSVRQEFTGPIRFPPEMSEEEIEAEVQRHISVDPSRVKTPLFSLGFRLAHGLDNYLWACPSCFAVEGLRLDPSSGNQLRCRFCDATWRVDIAQRLHPVAGDAQLTTVPQAYDSLLAHFGDPPRAAPVGSPPEVVLEDPGALYRLQADAERELVAEGSISLTERQLRVVDDEGRPLWSSPLEELQAVTIEGGTILQLRREGELLRLDFHDASVVKWRLFLGQYRALRIGS